MAPLERLAVEAYERGETWNQFFETHGDAIRKAEPFNRHRYHRLTFKLMAIVTGGNLDGYEPIGMRDPAPWELDDQNALGPSER